MKYRPKIVVVMPAHNAARTLRASYRRLPKKYIDETILVDDASDDNTFAVAKSLTIKSYRNDKNLGYGGNLKVCLTRALECGADIIIEYHPDNQYSPETLPLFLDKAKEGFAFALGSRFIHPKEALGRKMPLIKFIANRSLTFIDQFVLGIELSEFHSGFRMYTRQLLSRVPYMQNSNDYLFSFEIIVQAIYFGFRVAEIQVSCDYHPKMHTANLPKSSIYAIGTFKTLAQYVSSKFIKRPVGPFQISQSYTCSLCGNKTVKKDFEVRDAVSGKKFSVLFCIICQTGFTHPLPKHLAPYYPKPYYSKIKSLLYRNLQIRRLQLIRSILPTGRILDIGCGDGSIGYKLDTAKYHYTGIETRFSGVTNPNVKLVGIEGMKEKRNKYDLVTFWESFEHLNNPTMALNKAYMTLKRSGTLIIECPNYGSWERIPFGSRWFHLDPPRHLFHYTQLGLKNLLQRNGFSIHKAENIFALEYIPIGLAQSLLYRISPFYNVFAQDYGKKRTILLPLTVAVLAFFMIPVSIIFYLLGGSPIQLIVAQKTTKDKRRNHY